MRLLPVAATAGLMLGLVLGEASAAPILTNGDFATGDLSGWTVTSLSGGSPVVVSTGVDGSPTAGDVVSSYNGTTNAAYFADDSAQQALSQTVSLAANTTYGLSFGVWQTESGASNTYPFFFIDGMTDGTHDTLLNSFASQDIGTFTGIPVGAWTTANATYTTTAAGDYSLVFVFVSGPQPAKDVLLAGVSLTALPPEDVAAADPIKLAPAPVPLPSSAPLFGAAVFALGAVGYGLKRRKAAAT